MGILGEFVRDDEKPGEFTKFAHTDVQVVVTHDLVPFEWHNLLALRPSMIVFLDAVKTTDHKFLDFGSHARPEHNTVASNLVVVSTPR
jgi:hypothetical protein